MKKNHLYMALVAAICLCGCGGKGDGVKFNPQEQASTMTDAEREAAIVAKCAMLADVDTAVLVGHGVKLTIMTPPPDAERCITEQMSGELAMRMLSIASKGGVAGIGGNPDFVLAVDIASCDKKLTGTAPQKTMLTYSVAIYVGNASTGDVYGSTITQIVGTGDNERQAALVAAKELKDNAEIQQLLATASERIIAYYTANADAIKANAEALIAKGDIEQVFLLLRSVPQQSGDLFKYAQGKLPIVAEKLFQNDAEVQRLSAELASATATHAAEVEQLQQQLAVKQLGKAVECERKMTSYEMRQQIALENAAGSPFKMILYKLAYGFNNKIPMPK